MEPVGQIATAHSLSSSACPLASNRIHRPGADPHPVLAGGCHRVAPPSLPRLHSLSGWRGRSFLYRGRRGGCGPTQPLRERRRLSAGRCLPAELFPILVDQLFVNVADY
ncbi:hypothetical protein SETIT_7G047400v2 [Setaria italica]|uniref:Uncharacterized protein n=1 Tax=Setaria italica TaxID=4555 RepID=A0A368RSD0_SETIT|nr:hypothetical protein SETIT_7G047400v2 [Setaria italica]